MHPTRRSTGVEAVSGEGAIEVDAYRTDIVRVGIRLVSLKAIVALVIFVAGAATVGSLLFIVHSRNAAIERAQGELRNYAFVLAEQTEQALQAVEFVQKDIMGLCGHFYINTR
jgi:hypothetical protein